MLRRGDYLFRFASTPAEFAQIHRLNHRTFVQEIPQHADNGTGELVDKFHEKNKYLICLKGERIVGMLSSHDKPPFSIADRLPDPSILSRPDVRPLEIRLLAVEPGERHSLVLIGLVWELYRNARAQGYTHFVISGVEEQRELYEHLGFEPLGPPVGDAARFVPMWLPMHVLEKRMSRTMRLWQQRINRTMSRTAEQLEMTRPTNGTPATALLEKAARPARRRIQDSPICLLPGPVAMRPEVHAAFREPILYHRADEFLPLFEGVRHRLSDMVGGKPVGLFVGSGTLANDAVAATLAADPARDNGLVLVTGEFGSRLLRQANRWNLAPRVIESEWGTAWNLAKVEDAFKSMPPGGWVWATHHETSTGVLNDLAGLVALARRYGQRVCIDCVSSLATVPLDLSGVWLATGASGKAIGSYAGIAFVFADPRSLEHLNRSIMPTYLDIAATISVEGPRFTMPSPLIASLDAALEVFATPEARTARYREMADVCEFARRRLEKAGFEMLAPREIASPSILTFAPPKGLNAAEFVQLCRSWGYQIAGQSGYLAERRLVQIAVMGAVSTRDLEPLLDKLEQ